MFGNRIEIQGLDDARGQGFDWSRCGYLGLAKCDHDHQIMLHIIFFLHVLN